MSMYSTMKTCELWKTDNKLNKNSSTSDRCHVAFVWCVTLCPPWKVTSHYERERQVSYKQGQKERDFYHKIIRGKGPGDGLVWILITHLFFRRKCPPPMPLFCSLINDGEIAVHGRKYPLQKGPHPKWKETLSEQLEKRGIDNYLLARQQRHWLCKFSVRIKKTINNGKKRGNWLMVCTDLAYFFF